MIKLKVIIAKSSDKDYLVALALGNDYDDSPLEHFKSMEDARQWAKDRGLKVIGFKDYWQEYLYSLIKDNATKL